MESGAENAAHKLGVNVTDEAVQLKTNQNENSHINMLPQETFKLKKYECHEFEKFGNK